MDILRSNMFFTFNPTSWPTIWVKPIYLCLVIKNHSFSIINGPILIPLSKTLGMRELGNNSKMVSFATLVHPIQRLSKHASQVVLGNNLHVSKWTCYIIANAIPSHTSITRVILCFFSRFARSFGRPLLHFSISPPYILPHMPYRRLAHAHYNDNFASRKTASKLHQSLVLLFLRQQRHTATNDFTNCTSQTMEPRLHNAQEISRRSQLHNAHRDVNVRRVAVNKSKYFECNHFDISYFRNPIHFSLFGFTFL
jgi:hypothetical protein